MKTQPTILKTQTGILRWIFPLAIALALPLGASAEKLEWETDFETAKERAADEDKLILVDFTGSDWCGWCIKLKEEVFTKEEFVEYASETFVPLMIDFPRRTEQPDELKEQNRELMQKYGVRGFPTILVLDAEGEVVMRTGYRQGGPGPYIEHLKEELGEGPDVASTTTE